MTKSKLSVRKVLVVDSNIESRTKVSTVLSYDGYAVLEAETGQRAIRLASEQRPEIIILDSQLSDMSGYDVCSRLRRTPAVEHTPILFVSTNHGAKYVARALDSGGDDYVRRPFVPRELSARVRALLRRSGDKQLNTMISLGLEPDRHRVTIDERTVELTPTEFQLLEHLCSHPSVRHTASSLLQDLWQYPAGTGDTALVRNHIRNLRRKIEADPDRPAIILSYHGRGYMVNALVLYPERQV